MDVVAEPGLQVAVAKVAPDGEAAAIMDKRGRLEVFASDGGELLSQQYPGARHMALSGSAKRIVLAGRGRGSWWLRVIDRKGHTLWRQSVQGRVQSLAIRPDGDTAFAVTNGARMYVLDVRDRPAWRRVKTKHTLTSVQYANSADALFGVTVSPEGYGMVNADGSERWWRPRPAGPFGADLTLDGSMVLVTQASIAPSAQVQVALFTSEGRQVFSRQAPGYELRAAISSDGQYVSVSYRRKLVGKRRSVMERRIALWTGTGQTVWEQGGLFFKPVLAGMTERPLGVLVAEDYSLLSALNRQGNLAWRGPALRSNLVGMEHDEGWRLGWACYKDGGVELWRMAETR